MIYFDFVDFVKEYLVFFILVGCLLIALVAFIIIFAWKRNKHGITARENKTGNIINALGGAGNIVSVKGVRSRLTVTLKNPELINRDALKEYGVSSVVTMSEKISLVFTEDTAQIAQNIQEIL